MKTKVLPLFLVMTLSFYGQICAQTLATALPGANPATLIGVIAGVNGKVRIKASEPVGQIANSGSPVHLGDEISTGPKGKLQILLLDETVFTIGPNSSLVIDEFVYDPATHNGKIDARVLQGFFRLVTGKIAKKQPENVEVKLPTGSVGIRGTILYGKVEENNAFLMLLGPGEKNNTAHRAGAIDVKNNVNGKTVSQPVTKSGYGSEIKGKNEPPTPAFRVPDDQIESITAAFKSGEAEDEDEGGEDDGSGEGQMLSSGESDDDAGDESGDTGEDMDSEDPAMQDSGDPMEGDEGSAGDSAGQGTVDGLETLSDVESFGDFAEDLAGETEEAAQDFEDEDFLDDITGTDGEIITLDELTSRTDTGTAHYSGGGDLTAGSYTVELDINFSSMLIGGGNSNIQATTSLVNSGSQMTFSIGVKSYTDGSDLASFDFDDISEYANPNLKADLTVDLFNDGTEIAELAEFDLTVYDSSGSDTDYADDVGTGTLEDGPSDTYII